MRVVAAAALLLVFVAPAHAKEWRLGLSYASGVNVTDGANLALAYATQTTWERVRVDVIALKQSVRVGRGALSMSAGHSFEENFGSSLFISYQRPLGLQTSARSPIREFDMNMIDALFVPR